MKSDLLTQIKSKFQPGELFMMSDIQRGYMSDAASKKELLKLISSGSITRFSYGIYYLPGKMEPTVASAIELRYLRRGDKIYGFYTGDNFLSSINGVSPNLDEKIEIMSNHATSGKKSVYMFGKRFVIRKPYVEINKYNASLVSFLTYISMSSLSTIKEQYSILANYIRREHLSANDVMDMAEKFPNKTASKLISSDLYRSLWKH